MKISYNLSKRRTKTEKFENYFKMYIINLKTKGYELTALGNIINSILNYKLKRLVINLRLPKEQKQAKTAIAKSVEGIKNSPFTKIFFYIQKIFNRNWILFSSM